MNFFIQYYHPYSSYSYVNKNQAIVATLVIGAIMPFENLQELVSVKTENNVMRSVSHNAWGNEEKSSMMFLTKPNLTCRNLI